MSKKTRSAEKYQNTFFQLWLALACVWVLYGLWVWLGTPAGRWTDGIYFHVIGLFATCAAFYTKYVSKEVVSVKEGAPILYSLKDCWSMLLGGLLFFPVLAVYSFIFFRDGDFLYAFFLGVLSFFFFCIALWSLLRLVNREFLAFQEDGFVLRGVGFVPWNDVEVIAVETFSVVFIFQLSEDKSVSLTFWHRFFRAFRRKGARVFLRAPLNMLDKDPFEFYMICRAQYARYRSGARVGFDTPLKDIDRVIENEARSITFLTDIKKAASMF